MYLNHHKNNFQFFKIYHKSFDIDMYIYSTKYFDTDKIFLNLTYTTYDGNM